MARKPRAAEQPPRRSDIPPPRRFDDGDDGIIGQQRALATLTEAIHSERIHHAWIFHGPQGVGKCTAAIAFAGVLLDPTTGPDLSGQLAPDPESRVQQMLRSSAHPDLHLITRSLASHSREADVRRRKQTTIPKDVLREFLLEPSSRTRTVQGESRAGKVFIIDEADVLDQGGQNLLLKTLEEPPAGTVIILVTSHDDRLLPTIRSRCQRVAFRSLDHDAMTRWFERQGFDVDAEHRDWLFSFAAGAPGILLAAVESGIFHWHTEVDPILRDLDRGRFTPDAGQHIAQLVMKWAEEFTDANPGTSKEAANHVGAARMFRVIADHYQRRLREEAGRGEVTDALLTSIDLIAAAEREVAANVQVPFVIENLAAQIARRRAI